MDNLLKNVPDFNVARQRQFPSIQQTRQNTSFNLMNGDTKMSLCTPAILTLLFGIGLILYDITNGHIYTGVTRLGGVIIFATLLQLLCVMNMSWMSWILLVFVTLFIALIFGVVIYFIHYAEVKRDHDETQNNDE
jgi:predicted MFS family arabinose efflux permease